MKTSSLVLRRSKSVAVAGSIVALSLLFAGCTKSEPSVAAASDAEVAMTAIGTSGFNEDTSAAPTTDGNVGAATTDGNVSVAANEAVDKLVLTVDGGFTTWQTNVGILPLAFIADGKLLRGVPSGQPNPLAPQATTREIKGPALEEIAAWLYGAGFRGDPLDFGDPGVTDMPTTTLTFTISGEFYRQSAYALSFDTSGSGTTLSDEQQKNRSNFSRLIEFLNDPAEAYGAANFGTPTPYVPSAYSLWGARYGVPVNGDEKPPTLVKVPWPHTSLSLESFKEQPSCQEVDETNSSTVAATFASAAAVGSPVGASAKVAVPLERTTMAFAQPDGVLAELVLTPVYPGMSPCPVGEPFRIFGDPK